MSFLFSNMKIFLIILLIQLKIILNEDENCYSIYHCKICPDLDICEKCAEGYILNSEHTKCIKSQNMTKSTTKFYKKDNETSFNSSISNVSYISSKINQYENFSSNQIFKLNKISTIVNQKVRGKKSLLNESSGSIILNNASLSSNISSNSSLSNEVSSNRSSGSSSSSKKSSSNSDKSSAQNSLSNNSNNQSSSTKNSSNLHSKRSSNNLLNNNNRLQNIPFSSINKESKDLYSKYPYILLFLLIVILIALIIYYYYKISSGKRVGYYYDDSHDDGSKVVYIR